MILTFRGLSMIIFIRIDILMRRSIEKKVKAQIEKEQIGRQRMKGIKIEVNGRLRGSNRRRKKVMRYGRQNQQDRRSRIEQGAGIIYTKYGIIGMKVQSAKERREGGEKVRVRKIKR